MDLLYDTPQGTVATWTTTLAAALELAPDHLSLYALTLDDPDA
jgi:coproporphyrinogen III oxidase-like Fe-S oxidoreductase